MSEINLNTPQPITKNASELSEVTVKTASCPVGDTEYESSEQDQYFDVNVGIFFDGTFNNRENVDAGGEFDNMKAGERYNAEKAENAKSRWFGSKRSGSYTYDHSNISRSQPAYDEFKRGKLIQLSLYVEGIGTEDGEGDYRRGGGLGEGITGIPGKVIKACKKIVEKIDGKCVKFIETLTIDAFGFSRGAAAARHLIFELHRTEGNQKDPYGYDIKYETYYGALGEALESKGIKMRTLRVRYTGLYDTVASFGLPIIQHSNNTRMLGLGAVRHSAHVLQLAADDEHRTNFSLTNIKSKGSLEKFLPGVHADIGGGYTDDYSEEIVLNYARHFIDNLSDLKKDRDYLIEQGWYEPGEITLHKPSGTLYGKRTELSNKYSFIPLHIMTEYAIGKDVKFLLSKITGKYPIPEKEDLLFETKTRLYNYVFGKNVDKMSFDNPTDRIILKKLRNKYLHFSANYAGVGMGPRIENGVRKRHKENG